MTTTAGRPRGPAGRVRASPPVRLVLVGVLGLLGAGLLLLPDLVGLDRVLPFAVFAALRLPLAVAVWVVGVLVLVLRPRWWPALAPVLAVAVVAVAVVVPRAVPDPPPPAGGTDLVVLELNSFEGKADPRAIADAALAARADVVVLPEAGNLFRARLTALLPDYRGYSAEASRTDDEASTSVLLGPRVQQPQVRTVPGALFSTLDVTLSSVRIVAVHTAAPFPPERVGLWQEDLERLVAPVCASPPTSPTILVGDLNATPDQSAFRAATAGCTDALPSVGAGAVATYPTDLPRWFGIQIDHVLVGGGLGVADAEVLDVPGTDHRAVLARLVAPA